MGDDPAPLIVSALFGARDFAWLNALRRAHFPVERNQLDAHLTLFHHLPPSIGAQTRRRLNALTRGVPAPDARTAGILNLGGGTAIRIASPALEGMRGELADAFTGLLTPQDQAAWRPHVTIQNKVSAEEARRLQRSADLDLAARPVMVAGLALWRYRGGPWEPVSRHMFTTV